MATKKKKTVKTYPLIAKLVSDVSIVKSIRQSYLSYGTETIEERALPDFRDGLSPVQRRLLWTAYSTKLFPDRAYKKAATVAADAMGSYHPHGSLSLESALAGLVHLNLPLIDGMGGWGIPHLDIAEASSRYIEAKLTQDAMNVLFDDRLMDVSTMVPNFDGSKQEPLILPAKLPMSLVLGAFGIAVGVTTNIPACTPASVRALVKACLELKKGEPITVAMCAKHLRFAERNGGILTSKPAEQKAVLADGLGKLSWQCAYEIDAKKKMLSITGVPPDWPFSSRIAKLRSLAAVRQVKDLSAGGNVHVQVLLKPSISQAAAQGELEDIAQSLLTKTISYRFNVTERQAVVEDGVTKTNAKFFSTNAVDIMTKWLKWRLELETKAALRIAADLEAKLLREHLLLLATKNLDALIKIIRGRAASKDAKLKAIAKLLKCTIDDASFILTIPIGRFDRISEDETLKKCKALEAELKQAKIDAKQPIPAVLRTLPEFDQPKKAKKKRAA